MGNRKAMLYALVGVLLVSSAGFVYLFIADRSGEQSKEFVVKLRNASDKRITHTAVHAHDGSGAAIFESSQAIEPGRSISFPARYTDVARAWRVSVTFEDGTESSGSSGSIGLEGPLRVVQDGQERPVEDGGVVAKVYTNGSPKRSGEPVFLDIQSYEITVTADEVRTAVVVEGIEIRLEESG